MDRGQIISLAFALGQHIAESEEIKDFKAKQLEVMQDSVAVELLKTFEEARGKVMEQMEAGQEMSDEQQGELDKLEESMLENEQIKELINKQEKVNNMMSAVYYAIDQAASGGNDCGGSCESCGSDCF